MSLPRPEHLHVLLLGGSTEASALADALAAAGIPACFSYAGRVQQLRPQPLPTRVGGFGGVAGLVHYLRTHGVTHLVDATHPFAVQMSAHAVEAARIAGVPLLALTRPPWTPEAGDRWQCVPDLDAALAALDVPPRRVFLAVGRQSLNAFAARPQHHYVARLVEPPAQALPLPQCEVVLDRGPFTVEGDRALLQHHRIEWVVCKNAGGDGARAKLLAARELGLPVLMIERPALPPRPEVHSVEDVLAWLHQTPPAGMTERGV